MFKFSVRKDSVLLRVRMFQTEKSAQKLMRLCVDEFEKQGFSLTCSGKYFADLTSPDGLSYIELEIDEIGFSEPTELGARLVVNSVIRTIEKSAKQ